MITKFVSINESIGYFCFYQSEALKQTPIIYAPQVLSYHNAASHEEVEMICNEERPTEDGNTELAT